MGRNQEKTNLTGLEVAVIAMSGRFPGARNVDEFWEVLKNGTETIAFSSNEELVERGVGKNMLESSNFVKARGILDDIEFFDSSFFGYSAVEAEVMDPQFRIFYECTWEALETAGYNPDSYKGLIGLFAGASNNRFWEMLAIITGKAAIMGEFGLDHFIDRDFLSTRIAYKLNLRGPAVTLKTACSTGLYAVDMACRGLLTGQSDIALAGGVSFINIVHRGYLYEEGMINSPDGHCRAFDAKSRGVIFSDGAGVVVLKRLRDAVSDRDTILAVIKGTASNNDGSRKSTYEAPGTDGQAEVIKMALHISDVDPETVTYVETHGTGTVIGDPIEIEGLKRAFNTDKKGYCAIGSVKSNMGHLDTAAGIAGFIKTVLAIKHKCIPPSLHFETANPKIDFENSPFYVNVGASEWKNDRHPIRAGVSSFGVGGTNVHVILEEAPEPEKTSQSRDWQMVMLSARTEAVLNKAEENLMNYFNENPDVVLADAAYTLQVGRKGFKYRKMWMVESFNPDFSMAHTSTSREKNRPIFMFSGQGAQYANMGADLYRKERVFREELDKCFNILKPIIGYDIKEILYPPAEIKSELPDINQTGVTQPLIFAFEYALAKLVMHWGIKPFAMIGHSIGEYVAAYFSGVFSLEDALRVVALRGKLMQQMPSGAMLSVTLPEEELQQLLTQYELALAAVNAPSFCVVSGPHEAVDAIENQLKQSGHDYRRLHTSHAYHSKMMDPILEQFENVLKGITLNKPQLPYISNVTGKWITVEEAMSPQYWAKHLRSTVRFSDGVTQLVKEPNSIFIEVGPGRSLSTFVKKHIDKKNGQIILNLVKHPKEDIEDDCYLQRSIGQLWLYGEEIDWSAFYADEKRGRISLPTYPFERRRYWMEGDPYRMVMGMASNKQETGKRSDMAKWFYTPSWKRSSMGYPKPVENSKQSNWLVFIDASGIGSQLVERLQTAANGNISVVRPGPEFAGSGNGGYAYTVNPERADDYSALMAELVKQDRIPNKIVHLWNITGPGTCESRRKWDEENEYEYENRGFYSLIYLAQAIGKEGIEEDIKITVLADNLVEISGEEHLCPWKATLIGPAGVIPMEYKNISCRCIDVVISESGSGEEKRLIDQLEAELCTDSINNDSVVAFRNNYRLVQTFESVPLASFEDSGEGIPRLKEKGVYLITGGLGGMGLVIAQHLSKGVGAKLILTGRSYFPEREAWDRWLTDHDPEDDISRKIGKILEMEKAGSAVMVFSADVSDYNRMQAVIAEAEERLGRINGVIHAAGLPGGGMIQLKTPAEANKVMAPKVKGALVLDTILKDHPLDFFVLCSSINSVVPMLGQVDYFAANAFLDAFAYYKTSNDGIFTVSINWDAWQEVGMAVEAARQLAEPGDKRDVHSREVGHPLFDRYIDSLETPGREIYETDFRLDKQWVLNEHKIADSGKGLAPGVTYLEMARRAFEGHAGNGMVEISDVYFLNPMMLGEGEEREARLILEKQTRDGADGSWDFLIRSRAKGKEPGEQGEHPWQNHAAGKLTAVDKEENPAEIKHNIDEIKAKCSKEKLLISENEDSIRVQRGLLIFGPRWDNLTRVHLGEKQALAFLELNEAFTGDFDFFKLHPALLDSATGFLFGIVNKGSAYIPFSYKRLRMRKPLPSKVYCYNRLIEDVEGETRKESLKFDVTIMDEQGVELVDIKEFTMLQVTEEVKGKIKEKEVDSPLDEGNEKQRKEQAVQTEFLIKDGILPLEGIEAFNRILGGTLPQVVVSTIDLPTRIENSNVSASIFEKETDEEKGVSVTLHERPAELTSPYVAPRTEEERTVVKIWQEFLGIEQIGVNDNFFELGGDSLNIVQLNGKLKKVLKRDIPVAAMFSYLTVRSFVEYLKHKEQDDGTISDGIDRSEEIEKSKNRLKARVRRK